jgi:hypothetical protein
MWSERYDRPLKDIFAVQDEIVGKVVTTLSLLLKLKEIRALQIGGVPHQWVRSCFAPLRSVNRSVVANEKFATFCPDGRARMSGLAPRLPITITLLTDMTTNLLVRLRPLVLSALTRIAHPR